MATTSLAAQAFGEDDPSEGGHLLLRAIRLALTLSRPLTFQRQLADVSLLRIDASPEVERLTRVYFYIPIYAAPETLCLQAFHGVFLGLQNAHYPILLTVVVNLVNVVLNILFVQGSI